MISETQTASIKHTEARLRKLGRLAVLWSDLKRDRVSWFFLAPFLILFTLFTIIPVVTSIGMSFTYYNVMEPPKFIGLSNYKLLFVDDDIFLKAIGITLKFAFITGPVGYVLSFLLAWLISQIPN